MISWKIPKLHTIETRISSVPKQQQKDEMKNSGEKIQLGKYKLVEDNIIKENWKNFCEVIIW